MSKKEVDVKITKEDGSEKTVKIYVVRPNNNTIKNADRYRAKTWNQCITDGVLTKKELGKILKDRGIWSADKEDEQEKVIEKLQKLEKKLYLGKDDTKKLKLSEAQDTALEMRMLRFQLRELISDKISMEENTAEALADNAKFDYFVADCTYYENGEKVYKSVEDYNQKSSDQIAFSAAGALAEMMYQVDDKFEDNLPENKWLKNHQLVNQDGSLVNDKGDLVDQKGRKINKFGHYLNDDGQRVDIDGNLLDENGNYIEQAVYENDLTTDSSKETKKKKKVEQSETT
jgi:hypothetical protein